MFAFRAQYLFCWYYCVIFAGSLISWSGRSAVILLNATSHLLSVTNWRSSIMRYSVNSQELSSTGSKPWLLGCSLFMQPYQHWISHCRKATSKASRMLGLIWRTLKPCYSDVKKLACLSMVRPVVKYKASVWSPHTNKDVAKLEQVQKIPLALSLMTTGSAPVIPLS